MYYLCLLTILQYSKEFSRRNYEFLLVENFCLLANYEDSKQIK